MEILVVVMIVVVGVYLKGRHDGRSAAQRDMRGQLGMKEEE